jgi:hypothetical protein
VGNGVSLNAAVALRRIRLHCRCVASSMVRNYELLAGSEDRTCSYLLLTDTRTGSSSHRHAVLLDRYDCLALKTKKSHVLILMWLMDGTGEGTKDAIECASSLGMALARRRWQALGKGPHRKKRRETPGIWWHAPSPVELLVGLAG